MYRLKHSFMYLMIFNHSIKLLYFINKIIKKLGIFYKKLLFFFNCHVNMQGGLLREQRKNIY